MPPHQCAAVTVAGHQCTRQVWGRRTLCGTHVDNPNTRLFADIPLHQQQAPRPQCRNCTRTAVHGEYCGQHEQLRPRPDLPPEQRCIHPHCLRAARGHNRCVRHEPMFVRRQQRMLIDDLYFAALTMLADGRAQWRDVVAGWRGQAAAGEPFMDQGVVQHLELNLARDMVIPELWNLHMANHAPMNVQGDIGWRFQEHLRAPPRGELEAFVQDNQNVHTRVVTQQTNSALQILLNTDVPSNQKTVAESHLKFMEHVALDRIHTTLDVIDQVDRDVKRWYRTITCRTDGDYLYKRLLDGLWAKIKTSPVHQELEIRLWQEMVDSVGMCCDGHITRLANVLCGFDEAFAPELSPAEKLQNRMAVIANMDCGIILQTAHALAAFKEFDIPRDQWEPWIDAL